MNKKILCAALLGGLSFANHAMAQEFDDRWYLTGSAGFNLQDDDRTTRNAPFLGLGLGKFISPNWSLDGELNYQNPKFEDNQDLLWSQYGISLDLRRHFIQEGRGWNPYIVAGLGMQRSEEESLINASNQRRDNNLAAKLGVGLQTTLDKRVGVRAELAYRADFDDTSVAAPNESWFGDVLASVGVVIPLGPAPVAAVAPPPPAPAPTPAPPPAPAPITIDLNGVNFDFDKSTLRPDAVAILAEATEILKRYPDLRVEVAGHTDSVGTAAYNQGLSERRAKAVYDYLTSNGIDSSRLAGPVGYGLTRPIDTNETKEGRARNRRTELNVQN